MDSYSILGVSKNDSMDIIKKSYKQLALRNHPDRGGSESLFKLIDLSFKKICEEKKLKQIDKQFNELKSGFQDYSTKNKPHVNKEINTQNYNNISDFNTRFNKVFTDHKINDAYTNGYQDQMVESSKTREDINIKPTMRSFTIDKFNNQFDKIDSTQSRQLTKYKDPDPIHLNKQLQFTELGVDKIHDFSGTNDNKNNLHYMDYMTAHSTNRLIDPRQVKSRTNDFKNINHLKSDRENIQYQMSDEEIQRQMKKKYKEEKKEIKRQQIQQQQDNLYSKHYEKLNQIMMQYKK